MELPNEVADHFKISHGADILVVSGHLGGSLKVFIVAVY